MAHVEKYTQAAVNSLERHCTRKNEHYKNKQIDKEKTHENYTLDNNENPLAYMRERLQSVRMNQRRDDIKIAASWVLTQPRGLQPDESRTFFETAHKFLCDRYGQKNVLWSRVHMDESTPHLHFCFMPITQDKKHEGQEKVCAKDVLTRADLKSFHTDLSAAMQRVFGRDIGIETGKTEKSLPLETFKVQQKIDTVAAELDTKKKELDAVLANRKTFVDGRKLAQKIHDEHKPGLVGKNAKIDTDLLKEAIDYIWNSGGKDDEIAKLQAALDAAEKEKQAAKKTEEQRTFLANEVSQLRTRAYAAERETTKLQKVVDEVKKIDPAVHARAVAATNERKRGWSR